MKLVRNIFYTPAITALCLLCLGVKPAISAGTWTALANAAPGQIQTMLLLTDGTVMAEDANTWTVWYHLTPDIHGSYVNGTWSTLTPMHYNRLYYSSEVLPSGKVFIAGAEYGNGTTNAEIYDPVANLWTVLTIPAGLITTNNTASGNGENDSGFMDSFSALLSNGKVLVTPVVPANSGETVIYDPVANAWSSAQLVNGYSEDEATGVMLPDNSIIIVDNGAQTSERFIPSLSSWISDASVPVALFDPYGDEEGAAFLLPNGKAFFMGSTPVTALYTPSGSTSQGSWVAGPGIPGNMGQPDAPAAMMVNGKILCALSPTPTSTSNIFTTPTTFYEYDYSSGTLGTFTQVSAPGGGSSINNPTFIDRMLDLPDGTVLLTQSDSQLYVYTPDLTPLAAGQPTISSITQNSDGSYVLTGTKLNGISAGAVYGDDAQMNSNYPLVRMTNNATGNVYYARTYNWTPGIMTGNNSVTTQFIVPSSAPVGAYSLVVVANGNASSPVSFVYSTPFPILAVVTNIVSGGNGNGIIDFDECNNLTILLTNTGGVAATGVEATLSSTTTGAIVAQGASAYPTILPNGGGANLTYFTLSTEPSFICGTPINLVLVVKCNQLVQTNYIQLPSGIVGTPDSFTSSTAIPIPSTGTPINSPIAVSGLQAVGKVTVSVFLTAASDFGLSLQLQSPNGTSVVLSQFNGGVGPSFANFGTGCAQSLETTFDDAASLPISLGSAPFIGSYAPQQPLSVYHLMNGANLNGTWNLQVLDAFPGNTAVLGCWSLNISPEVCIDGGGQCPGADLSLTMSASPNPVYVNSNLVYTLTVSNAGPSTADNILITQTLPAGVNFVTSSGYPVSASTNGMNLNLNMGSLPVYGSATISVITTVTTNVTPGLISSSAVVGSAETDPNPNNNTASASVIVTEPLSDLAVSMTGTPSSVLQDGLLTYTINVTNNGPFTAFNVTNVTTLPPNVNIISHTATQQGTLTVNGLNEVVVTWNSIGLGSNAVVTIVVSPTFTGSIAANTQVVFSPLEVDPNLFNNAASVSTTVGQAADLSVAAFTVPSLVLAGTNVNYIVTVSNAGGSAATNVVFTQSLPSQSTFVTNNWPAVTTTNNNLINITFTNNLLAGGTLLITNVIKSPALLFGVKSNSMTSTFSVFGQPGDPNTNNNTLTLVTTEEPATVTIVAAGAMLTSGSANGSVGTNGTYGVEFFLQNVGNIPTSNLVATLQTNSGLTPVTGSNIYTYGVLQPEAAPTNGQFEFVASSTNGGTIYAVLQLQDGSTNLGLITNTFIMPFVQTFSTNRVIFIPNPTNSLGHPNTDEIGQGYPYPSTIMVSNVNGNVSKVTVTISNLTHAFASDVGLLLVGPSNSLNTNGVNCVLMSACGQWTGILDPITLIFDQNGPSLPGEYGDIVPGTYQPTDYYTSVYGTTEAYSNSLVPVGPYNTNLTVFNSLPANGTWNLYAYDFAVGDSGMISNGWSLSITTITPVNLTDVAATMVTLTNSVYLGANITNVWTVTNNGPNTTTAYVTNILPAGLTFVSSTLSPTVQSGQTNIYYLLNFASGSNVVVTNVIATTNATGGSQTNTISVGSSVLDTNLVNNTAFAVTTVVPPPVGLDLAPISINPNTTNAVAINSSLIYTLFVTNNGPSNAFNVVGSFALSGLQFDSILYPLDAAYTLSNGVVQCDLGTIPAGGVDEFEIMATATNIGVVTNVWSVTTTSGNTNSAGNSVSAIVKVTNAMPAIAIASVTLQPPNFAVYSNQTNTVSLTLTNGGWAPTTTNFKATLQTNSGVTPVAPGTVTYGVITNGGAARNNSFTFVSSGSPGSIITAVWSLQDGTNFLGTVSNTFLIPSLAMSFTNTGAIYIPSVGQGQPYPSTIQVSVPTNLLVSKVTVTLNGFKHSFPHDVEAMLVSPAGQGVLLMASTGGPYNVSNLVLTFDDTMTTNGLPTNSALFSGTFACTSNSPFYSLPNLPALSGTGTNLAYLNGTSPNGTNGWSLYVYDDSPGNDGAIVNGWSLGLTLISPVDPAARLVVTSVAMPSPVVAGDYLTNQVTVYNSGPDIATGVFLTNVLTSSSGAPLTSSVYLGPINAFNEVSANIVVQTPPGATGYVTNTAFAIASNNADLYLADSTNVTITPVTSDPVPAPVVSVVGGALHLGVYGYPGQSYVLQATTNMGVTNSWTNICTNVGVFVYTNDNLNGPQRFYRVLHQPQ